MNEDAFAAGFNEVRGNGLPPSVDLPSPVESTLQKFENATAQYEKQPPAPMSTMLSNILSRNKMRPVQQ